MASEFSNKIYSILKEVPRGKVTTYKSLADKIGSKAYRAVGNAMNKNRNKNIPCHRVICSDGRIGGYAYGKKKKIEMLRKEGIRISKGKILDFEKCRLFLKKL
jgi:methylated-DNA-[protein]-cysteine S-methyltransferase